MEVSKMSLRIIDIQIVMNSINPISIMIIVQLQIFYDTLFIKYHESSPIQLPHLHPQYSLILPSLQVTFHVPLIVRSHIQTYSLLSLLIPQQNDYHFRVITPLYLLNIYSSFLPINFFNLELSMSQSIFLPNDTEIIISLLLHSQY